MRFGQQRGGLQAAFVEQRFQAAHRLAVSVAQAQRIVAYLAQFGLDAVDAQPHHFAGGGQQHAAALALEQLRRQALLQRRHRARHRRRGAVQRLGGAADAAAGGDGVKRAGDAG
jgi:hypothetical protein